MFLIVSWPRTCLVPHLISLLLAFRNRFVNGAF